MSRKTVRLTAFGGGMSALVLLLIWLSGAFGGDPPAIATATVHDGVFVAQDSAQPGSSAGDQTPAPVVSKASSAVAQAMVASSSVPENYALIVANGLESDSPNAAYLAARLVRKCIEASDVVSGLHKTIHTQKFSAQGVAVMSDYLRELQVEERLCQALTPAQLLTETALLEKAAKGGIFEAATRFYSKIFMDEGAAKYPWLAAAVLKDAEQGEILAISFLASPGSKLAIEPWQREALAEAVRRAAKNPIASGWIEPFFRRSLSQQASIANQDAATAQLSAALSETVYQALLTQARKRAELEG